MTPVVVDSSVVIKWFVAEVLTPEAIRLRDSGRSLHAPALLDVEVANIAWKKIRRNVMTRAEGDFILSQLPLLPVARYPDGPLLPTAFDLADRTQRTIYDCLYLALALQVGGQMVTADDRLANALAGTAWSGSILRLSAVP